jgi:hypothetical protein
MNQELRHSRKKMLFNKYNKIRSRDNWEKYRTQRNLVNKIKRKSTREYFIERCVGGPKQKDFWPTALLTLILFICFSRNEISIDVNKFSLFSE